MCVSPTFASPIEKPTTSTRRRICREIIGNTEGNAKTEDSLRHCKWANSTSKSAPKTKKPTGGPVGGESKKWSEHRDSNPGLSGPKPDALPDCAMLRNHVVNISAEPRISSALCKFHSAGETDREWKNFPSRYSMTEYAPKRVSDPQDVSPRPLESRSKNGV